MTNQLYEITVSKPDGKDTFWHLAPDPQSVAELLADSVEAQRGYSIAIKPATPVAMMQLATDHASLMELCGNDAALLQDFLFQFYRVCMECWVFKTPFHSFHIALTEPKGTPNYAKSHGTCVN